MTAGYLFLLGSLLGFSLLGILHKVADHPSCRPRMVTMLLLIWAAALTSVYTLAFQPGGLRMPASVLAIGSAAGAAASLALFAFQASLRYGKISTSWLVLNLCIAVPLLISIIVYGEAVTIGKGVGVALVFAAILLMWWDKRIDQARSAASATEVQAEDAGAMAIAVAATPTPNETTAETMPAEPTIRPLDYESQPAPRRENLKMWLLLIMLAFLANGLAASSQKVLVELGDGDYAWQFYVVLYAAGAAVVAIVNAMNAGRPNGREMGISAAMAVASVAGNICIVKALATVPGTIAYPVANGGSLFLVVLAGVLAFRERVNPVGLAGIVLGIAATVILVLA